MDYIRELAVARNLASADLLEVRKGGTPDRQGTWCKDYRIAMRFAQWLSPAFAVRVDDLLVRMMAGRLAAENSPDFRGVKAVVIDGKAWYPYVEVGRALGVKWRRSAARRKARNLGEFLEAFGRNFITRRYASLLEGYYAYRLQLPLPFPEEEGGVYGSF